MKKKIFFIIPSIASGGAERVFVSLVNKVNKSIFDVTLIYLFDEQNVYDVNSDIRVINLNVKRTRYAVFKILRLVRRESPSLIFSTLGEMNMMLLMIKKFFPKNIKLIIRQTNIKSFYKSEGKIVEWIQKRKNYYYNNADKIVCQSELMKNDFIENTGIHRNVVKIYNPVDIELILMKARETIDYNFKKGQKNLFFTGRLHEVKRITLIMDAFKNFHINNKQSKLYILGDGPERNKLEEYIKEHRLSNSVKLLGFQQNPYKWLSKADLFIMASKHEGMPNALLEALVLNIPVLILKHPGGTEDIMKVLDIEDRFVQDLTITKKSFYNYNENIRSKLLENFSINKIIKNYEELFIEVLEED